MSTTTTTISKSRRAHDRRKVGTGLRIRSCARNEPRDCPLCPRLVAIPRRRARQGTDLVQRAGALLRPRDARLLIVGLAPGLQGANRTGRPVHRRLRRRAALRHACPTTASPRGSYGAHPDDGLELTDCLITNAVRCVPPENKPTTAEIATCRHFLAATIAVMPKLRAIVALGRIAHDSVVTAFGAKVGAAIRARRENMLGPLRVFDSYHCSRYNTNTGVLTPEMFEEVFLRCANFSRRSDRSGRKAARQFWRHRPAYQEGRERAYF